MVMYKKRSINEEIVNSELTANRERIHERLKLFNLLISYPPSFINVNNVNGVGFEGDEGYIFCFKFTFSLFYYN